MRSDIFVSVRSPLVELAFVLAEGYLLGEALAAVVGTVSVCLEGIAEAGSNASSDGSEASFNRNVARTLIIFPVSVEKLKFVLTVSLEHGF